MKAALTAYNLKISAAVFKIWGVFAALKGFYDLVFGEPEANLYSPVKWEFVTYKQWLTWGGFEIAYGILCAAFGYFLYELYRGSGRLPDGNSSAPPDEES